MGKIVTGQKYKLVKMANFEKKINEKLEKFKLGQKWKLDTNENWTELKLENNEKLDILTWTKYIKEAKITCQSSSKDTFLTNYAWLSSGLH